MCDIAAASKPQLSRHQIHPPAQEAVAKVAADEASAACYQTSHALNFSRCVKFHSAEWARSTPRSIKYRFRLRFRLAYHREHAARR